jgi:hypothetical protein
MSITSMFKDIYMDRVRVAKGAGHVSDERKPVNA